MTGVLTEGGNLDREREKETEREGGRERERSSCEHEGRDWGDAPTIRGTPKIARKEA